MFPTSLVVSTYYCLLLLESVDGFFETSTKQYTALPLLQSVRARFLKQKARRPCDSPCLCPANSGTGASATAPVNLNFPGGRPASAQPNCPIGPSCSMAKRLQLFPHGSAEATTMSTQFSGSLISYKKRSKFRDTNCHLWRRGEQRNILLVLGVLEEVGACRSAMADPTLPASSCGWFGCSLAPQSVLLVGRFLCRSPPVITYLLGPGHVPRLCN